MDAPSQAKLASTQVEASLDTLIERQERQRKAEEDYERAAENYERTDRERVAVRRETNRRGWVEFWRRAAATHSAMAEEALAKAEMYEGMRVANLPLGFPSRNGHGP